MSKEETLDKMMVVITKIILDNQNDHRMALDLTNQDGCEEMADMIIDQLSVDGFLDNLN